MYHSLQSLASQAATPCDLGCNPIYPRLQPYVSQASSRSSSRSIASILRCRATPHCALHSLRFLRSLHSLHYYTPRAHPMHRACHTRQVLGDISYEDLAEAGIKEVGPRRKVPCPPRVPPTQHPSRSAGASRAPPLVTPPGLPRHHAVAGRARPEEGGGGPRAHGGHGDACDARATARAAGRRGHAHHGAQGAAELRLR